MSTSKLQCRVSKLLSIHLGQYTIRENIHPDWLTTPEGARLELDFYIEELEVAIEVQGAHHYIYTPYFHGDAEGFSKRLKWDRFKQDACITRGIQLYEVSNEYDMQEVFEKLTDIEYKAIVHPNAVASISGPGFKRTPKRRKHKKPIINRWLDTIKRERERERPRQDRIAKYQKKIIEKSLKYGYSTGMIMTMLGAEYANGKDNAGSSPQLPR